MDFKDAAEILESVNNVRFADLLKVAKAFFGEPRIRGSHHVFKVPWMGEPFVNLQATGRNAKPYQVRQVLKALEKLEQIKGSVS